jgi:hypothetical protein
MRFPSVTSAGGQDARLASWDRQRFSGLPRREPPSTFDDVEHIGPVPAPFTQASNVTAAASIAGPIVVAVPSPAVERDPTRSDRDRCSEWHQEGDDAGPVSPNFSHRVSLWAAVRRPTLGQ